MYTKKELQDLVAYCKARGIQVLPEVEMPGHNMALAASYPEFCCNTKRAQVWTHGGVSSKLICPQKPATKKFLKDTFNTVQQIFPFRTSTSAVTNAPWETGRNARTARPPEPKRARGIMWKSR